MLLSVTFFPYPRHLFHGICQKITTCTLMTPAGVCITWVSVKPDLTVLEFNNVLHD